MSISEMSVSLCVCVLCCQAGSETAESFPTCVHMYMLPNAHPDKVAYTIKVVYMLSSFLMLLFG